MGSFSIWHWLIVLVIVLLIFGTKKLRNVGQDLGGAVKGFKDGKRLHIVNEATDVVYHVLVLMAFFDMSAEDILQEMHRREGISGIDEKRSRQA